MCEEFHCLPADAIDAIENDIQGLISKILDLRTYAKAKQIYEEGQKETDMSKRPQGAAIERVRENVFAIAKEKIQRSIEEQQKDQ